MKIMQVISQLGNGGAEKLVVELSNELEKNNEVILVSFRKIEDWMFFPKKLKNTVKIIELNKKDGFDILFLMQLIQVIRNENPQIIHIHLQSTLRYFMTLIPFFKKINYIYTMHNTFKIFEKSFQQYSKIWFFKRIQFVCLSDGIKKDFINSFKELNFTTISNGIKRLEKSKEYKFVRDEVNSYKNNNNTNIFLFVGRLNYAKNIPLLLNVLNKLSKKNIKLLIIGMDMSKKQELLSLIKKYSLDNIIYLGAKENVQDYMESSDALILTSRHEGLPLVVLEALSIGLPVITTPVGGLPSVIINKKHGFLSKEISTKSILNSIDLFLNLDKKEKREIETNNINLFNHKYSIELCANKYNILYKEKI